MAEKTETEIGRVSCERRNERGKEEEKKMKKKKKMGEIRGSVKNRELVASKMEVDILAKIVLFLVENNYDFGPQMFPKYTLNPNFMFYFHFSPCVFFNPLYNVGFWFGPCGFGMH